MKLNFNKYAKNIAGTEIKDATIGQVLGNVLYNSTATDSLFVTDLAIKLYNNQEVELSEKQVEFLREFVDKNPTLVAFVKAEILKVLN